MTNFDDHPRRAQAEDGMLVGDSSDADRDSDSDRDRDRDRRA